MKSHLARFSLLATIVAIFAVLLVLTGCTTPTTGNRALSDRGGGGNNAGFNGWQNTQTLHNPQYHTHYHGPGDYTVADTSPDRATRQQAGMHAIIFTQDDSGDDVANPKELGATTAVNSPNAKQETRTDADPKKETEAEADPDPNPEGTTALAAELDRLRRENARLRAAPQPDPAPPVGEEGE